MNDRVPSDPLCAPDMLHACHVCRDEAAAGIVVVLDDDRRSATVQIDGQVVSIALDLVSNVDVGDRVLIHQGFAIAKLERP